MFFKRKIVLYLPLINNRDRESHKLIFMPVKLRLQRHGKKGKPFYWIVAADTRAKRDGRYLEKLGSYNPNLNPAKIELNIDSAVKWLENGAQPTDTTRAILSNQGVLLKKHLSGGVKKGALTEEEAEKKFQEWLTEKKAKTDAKKSNLQKEKDAQEAKALAAEKAANEARIAAALPKAEETAEATEENTEVAAEETAQVAEETAEIAAEETAEVAEETEENTEVAAEETAEIAAEETAEVAEVAEETEENTEVAAEETAEIAAEETAEVAEVAEETSEEE
jgi:small subunit ribosomal protein S16